MAENKQNPNIEIQEKKKPKKIYELYHDEEMSIFRKMLEAVKKLIESIRDMVHHDT